MTGIKTDNELIAEFMGLIRHKPGTYNKASYWEPDLKDKRKNGKFLCYYDGLEYSTSWDWLMPACKKWDDLEFDSFSPSEKNWYMHLCDVLDNAVSCYEITPAYNQLVDNIKWYNQIQS